MSIKNVVLVGAGGNLGPSILKAFLEFSSFNVTVFTREGSTSTFPEKVKVVHVNYESHDSLVAALKGQDAIVSIIAGHVFPLQNKIIDAAIVAGVQRFIPSEFGSNTLDPKVIAAAPFLQGKVDVQKYLQSKEKDISWTNVITGPFFDWCVRAGVYGIDGKTKTATLIDNGNTIFSTTNLITIGKAIVKILEKAEETKNQNVFVSSVETSQRQMLELAEKITGEKFKVENISSKDVAANGFKKLQAGDGSGVVDLLKAIFSGEGGLTDLRPHGLWNDKLGLEKDDFEESFKAGWNGKLYGE